MAAKTWRLTERDKEVAVTLTAALAAPGKISDADEIVSTLQDVMTALAERGGVAGVAKSALEIASLREKSQRPHKKSGLAEYIALNPDAKRK